MDTELREVLAGAPDLGRWSFRLPGRLEQKFVSETDAERDRQIRFWVGCGLAFSWLCCACDRFTIPDVWLESLLARLCVVTPVSLAAMWLLARPAARWVRSVAAIAPPCVATLVILLLFGLAAEPDTFRSGVVLPLAVLWINAVVPLRLRDTLIFSAATMAAGDLINVVCAARHHVPNTYVDIVFCLHVLVGLSVLARLQGERQSRRSFVLGLRLQHQAEDLRRSNARLLKMSNTDPLTGLANRRSFDLALAEACRAAQAPLAVMMIDVDHFKLFNDAAGHLEGDRCLTVIARTIAGQVRDHQDLPARFGGEEFVVLMPGSTLGMAREAAERVLAAISALKVFHPGAAAGGFVTVSIGVAAMLPTSVSAAEELLAAADKALYAAKRAGRSRVMCDGLRPVGAAAA